MATASSTSGGGSGGDPDSADQEKPSASQQFECNICLETATEPVVSHCGHLFCWACVYRWMETQGRSPSCPVCKSGISRDKVIPLYGRGGSGNTTDPRSRVPPRPQGQRSEPEAGGGLHGFADGLFGQQHGGTFQFTFGIGGFPFAFFGTNFNMNGQNRNRDAFGQVNTEEDAFLSKVFLYIAIIFVVWLLLA
ncbi:hypothetical protein BOX15_Mlig003093g1 [Macrostomum lignano]|uniref:RING-type E3 ubiquitin transferase n=2 Tax=Macrostomum lignano TaxID=282301 RepID=A0A1I8JNJ7_9PLAT|nr:hypothetical protein BOX15_Mlig003093g1 [Macrostomum lignano]